MTESADVQPEGVPLHETTMTVRWGDMDALGHVNNIMYFRYFEQARIDWYESAGFEPLQGGRTGMVIVDAHAEFVRPVHYPATVEIRMAGHSPGRSSFVSTYTLGVGDTLYTRGRAKVVWISHATGRSTPLPDALRDRLTAGPAHG